MFRVSFLDFSPGLSGRKRDLVHSHVVAKCYFDVEKIDFLVRRERKEKEFKRGDFTFFVSGEKLFDPLLSRTQLFCLLLPVLQLHFHAQKNFLAFGPLLPQSLLSGARNLFSVLKEKLFFIYTFFWGGAIIELPFLYYSMKQTYRSRLTFGLMEGRYDKFDTYGEEEFRNFLKDDITLRTQLESNS